MAGFGQDSGYEPSADELIEVLKYVTKTKTWEKMEISAKKYWYSAFNPRRCVNLPIYKYLPFGILGSSLVVFCTF